MCRYYLDLATSMDARKEENLSCNHDNENGK